MLDRTTFDLHRKLVEIRPLLLGYATKLTGNIDNGEDLVSDAMVRICESIDTFTPGTNFDAWAVTITRNLHFSQYRKAKRLSYDEKTLLEIEDNKVTPEQELISKDGFACVREALKSMPDKYRTVILLIADGWTYEDIAAWCGIPVGTIKSRVRRCRIFLAHTISRELKHPPCGKDRMFGKKISRAQVVNEFIR